MASGSEVKAGPIAVLLVVLCAAGGWNYHRNATIENQVVRPYKGYSDEDLHQLISAYEGEVQAQMERYRSESAKTSYQITDAGGLEERIDEFERVQQLSKQRQERAYKVTEVQILVEQLAQEQIARERDRPAHKMILRRLLTF